SPRLFESAAFHNTLVLHEGAYEDLLEPDVDYICVKKDYSNVADIVERMRDESLCERMASRAYDKLIASKALNYQSFVRKFDAIIEQHRPVRAGRTSISKAGFY